MKHVISFSFISFPVERHNNQNLGGNTTMKGAVIYARYSCERQTEQSIEGQLRECYKYAEQNGLTIIHEYIDRAMTGTNDNRPSFQKMLADAVNTL